MTSIRVVTGCRLHFGLLAPFGVEAKHGGCGVMLEGPGVDLLCEPAAGWSIEGPTAERLRNLVDQLLAKPELSSLPPRRIEVRQAPPEHVGLGLGTQVSLALAQALVVAATGTARPAVDLARWTGRGNRSGIGTHGFARGGFLAEAPRPAGCSTSDSIQRCPIPPSWRFLVAIPGTGQGRHGSAEAEAFARPVEECSGTREELATLLWDELLPAIRAASLSRVGAALTRYNRQAGSFYRAVQGGDYSSPWISRAVELLLEAGAAGAGQSSWGPAVFGLVSAEQAESIREKLAGQSHWAGCRLLICMGRNEGAAVLRGDAPVVQPTAR